MLERPHPTTQKARWLVGKWGKLLPPWSSFRSIFQHAGIYKFSQLKLAMLFRRLDHPSSISRICYRRLPILGSGLGVLEGGIHTTARISRGMRQ